MPLETFRSFGHALRRRRLLTDSLSNSADRSACRVRCGDAPSAAKPEHYEKADFWEHQWLLLDLVPRRWIVLAGWMFLGVGAITGLEAAYAWMLRRVAAGAAPVAVLTIDAKGSLACWFSSLLLLAAAVVALLVYHMRRCRTDDYRGRYHVWLWAAGCWFLMATDQAASLREGFRELMISLTGTPLWGDGTLWWVVVYVFLWIAVGSRLIRDMVPSRLSIAALTTAATAHGLVLADWLGWIVVEPGQQEVMFRTGCEMAGNLMLLAAMLVHARYVLLDAEGLLPRCQRAKTAAEDVDESEEAFKDLQRHDAGQWQAADNNRWLKVDAPHAAPQPAKSQPAKPPVVAFASASTSASAGSLAPAPINRKLTKGERKALKARLLRERAEREGRSG